MMPATAAEDTSVGKSVQKAKRQEPIHKMLLIEDNKVFRHTFKNTLLAQFPSMQIEEASGGSRTPDIVWRWQPQVISMDIHLPGESGLTLTRKFTLKFPIP